MILSVNARFTPKTLQQASGVGRTGKPLSVTRADSDLIIYFSSMRNAILGI